MWGNTVARKNHVGKHCSNPQLEVSKKTENPRKPEKTKPWKKPIKPIKILKKPTCSVRFRFYKPKTEKTKPNPNRKKLSQTGFVLKNRTEPKLVGLNRFWFF